MVTFDSTDLDNAVSESGVVHESVANTDHDNANKLKQGYSIESPYLSSNLVGYWPLQEDSGSTAYDFSGNGNDGSITGATVNQTGLLGTSSYSFDGEDDYIALNQVRDVQNGNIHITGWMKVGSYSANQGFISASNGSDYSFILRAQSDGGIHFFIHDNGSNISISQSGPATGTWFFVDAYYDNSVSEIGLSINSGSYVTTSGSPSRSSSSWNIGRQVSTGSEYWYGGLCEVRVYDRVLTSTEIQTLYDVVNTSGTLTTGYKSV